MAMPVIDGAGLGTPLQNAGVPVAGTDEVQTLTLGGTPTGGTFALAFGGFQTTDIPWNSVNATLLASIQAALRALPSIGANNLNATAGTLTAGIGTVLLTFVAGMGKKAVANITVAANALTGTTPTVANVETTPGVDATGRSAPTGGLLTDTSAGKVYINTSTTLGQPTWVSVGSQT